MRTYSVSHNNRLFSDCNVLRGSVATYARSGWTFNNQFTAKMPWNLTMKKYNYVREFVATLFGPTLYESATLVSIGRMHLALHAGDAA